MTHDPAAHDEPAAAAPHDAQAERLVRDVTFYSQGTPCAGVLRLPPTHAPGQRHPAVVLCAGMSLTKEVWLPDHAARFNAAGFVTLNFDYRGFGASAGAPRRRLDPEEQVTDTRNALTFLESCDAVDADRLALYGVSLGASVATAVAGRDERPKAMVAVAGPMDLGRVWGAFPTFAGFRAKVDAAHRRFVATGEVSYVNVPRLLSGDPATAALLKAEGPRYPTWEQDVTFESLRALFAFRPEADAATIAPTAALWIAPENDDLIARFELGSVHAAARAPKKLVVLEGAEHVDVYKVEGAFERVMRETLAWYAEHV